MHKSTSQEYFRGLCSGKATINLNADVLQTNDIVNSCNEADCFHSALNTILLTADKGATIEELVLQILDQTNTLYNGCSNEAFCIHIS